jgi:hypothetical protein
VADQEGHMSDVMEIQKKRFDFLNTLYDESGADRFRLFPREYIGQKIGLDPREAENIIDYLGNEELVDTTRDTVSISQYGIKEVEAARNRPEKQTDHFPANIINIGTMIDSQILQASPGAMQVSVITAQDRSTIEEAISLLKEHMDELKLPPEQERDVRADMETIEAQMKSSKPKWTVIKESATSSKEILQTVAAVSTAAQSALQLLSMLHH